MDRRTALALVGASALLSLTACTAQEPDGQDASRDIRPVENGRRIDSVDGQAAIVFDPVFLDHLGGEVRPLGNARGTGATVRMPITFGQLEVSSTEVTGAVSLGGSSVRFPGVGAAPLIADPVLDLQASTVAGSLRVAGEPVRSGLLLMQLDLVNARRAQPAADEALRLTGVRLLIAPKLADLLNDAVGGTPLVAGRLAGVLSLSIART